MDIVGEDPLVDDLDILERSPERVEIIMIVDVFG